MKKLGLSQALAKRSLIRNLLGDARRTAPAFLHSFLYPFFAEPDPRHGLPAILRPKQARLLPSQPRFPEGGYPVDSGSPNILWFGNLLGFMSWVDDHLVSRGVHGYCLLD